MKFSELGEKKVIEGLRSILPVGDDCFVLPHGGVNLVLTTDMVYRPTHILDEMGWASIGRHIVAINFSDVAAMGAKPLAFLLSFGGEDMREEDFTEMIKAASDLCAKYGAEYVGGDLNETDELTLAGFALGESDKPVYRKGACVGDLVCVTGVLGGAALGVEVLTKRLSDDWDSKDLQEVLGYTLESKPRVDEGFYLRDYASSMTDISDSLAASLNDIAKESAAELKIDETKIPLPEAGVRLADSLKINLGELALYGGGDYELLFTVSPDDFPEVEEKTNSKVIGAVAKGSGVKSNVKVIERRGFEHFKRC